MIISPLHPIKLTYCMNVHPGESFADQWKAVKTHAPKIRSSLKENNVPFALGLRLGQQAVDELQDPEVGTPFIEWCYDRAFYVATVNGFPYGKFHGTEVKADVYRPDWTDNARRLYTFKLACSFAVMLPLGVTGCISTVPLWYSADYPDEAARKTAMQKSVAQLRKIADHLEMLSDLHEKDIVLALEPEPGCALETSHDVLAFFETLLAGIDEVEAKMIRQRIGVCVDTCHCALAFEKPADVINRLISAGIRVPKIQLSAALSVPKIDNESIEALKSFTEPVYFHQTAQKRDAEIQRWPDLPEALDDFVKEQNPGETRVHFHVPLQWGGVDVLGSTRETMDAEFWKLIRGGVCDCLEIETYTFNVLPQEMGLTDLSASIVEEYRWVMDKVRGMKDE